MKQVNHHAATPGTPIEAQGCITLRHVLTVAAELAKEASLGKARRVKIHAPLKSIQATSSLQYVHKHFPPLAAPLSKDSHGCKGGISLVSSCGSKRNTTMSPEQIKRAKSMAAKAAPYLDRLPQEQIEAMLATAVKYHANGILETIKAFKASVTPEEFNQLSSTPNFMDILAAWDQEQHDHIATAIVDEYMKVIPAGVKVDRQEVAAYLEINKMKCLGQLT